MLSWRLWLPICSKIQYNVFVFNPIHCIDSILYFDSIQSIILMQSYILIQSNLDYWFNPIHYIDSILCFLFNPIHYNDLLSWFNPILYFYSIQLYFDSMQNFILIQSIFFYSIFLGRAQHSSPEDCLLSIIIYRVRRRKRNISGKILVTFFIRHLSLQGRR